MSKSIVQRGQTSGRNASMTEARQATIIKLTVGILNEYSGHSPEISLSTIRSIGYQLGKELSPQFVASNLDDLIIELGAYWQRNGIGRIHWDDRDQNILSIKCWSYDVPHQSRACVSEEGLLEAVLNDKLEERIEVKEIARRSETKCVFKIHEKESVSRES